MTTILFNSKLTTKINSIGAELFSLKKNQNEEYIWEGNPQFWGKHSPILFPIVGALKHNTYQYKNQNYTLSRHGFAREMEFSLLHKTTKTATFSIKSNKETLQVYPFEFELQIKYKLNDDILIVDYTVINNSKVEMPFSIGAHPAIALPNAFENYGIVFEKTETLNHHLLENNLISNTHKQLDLVDNKMPLNYQLFENDALIFKTLESNSIIILNNSKPYIKFNFEDFPSLGIWTVKNAPFVCIEPWLGYADTVNNSGNILEKEGILILEPDKKFNAQFSIQPL